MRTPRILMPSALSFGASCTTFLCAGLGIVGVDQENHTFRPRPRKVLERHHLVSVYLHKGVRHRADNRNAVALAGEHVGRARKTGNVAGARRK